MAESLLPRLRIFLSHVHVESRFADFLKSNIERDFIGLAEIWCSSDGSVLSGKNWLDEMTAALRTSDLHMVLCSPDAVTRHWISFETGAAHLRGIPLIPLCHSGLTPAQLPVPLSQFQGVLLLPSESTHGMPGGMRYLYRTIAEALGCNVPAVDFEQYERELASLEHTYAAEHERLTEAVVAAAGVEVVRSPRALCISSQQFMREGFQNQLQLVLDAFPSSLAHDRVFDSSTLRATLMREKVHIVHIAAYVCPRSGDVYFSDVNLGTGEPDETQPLDKIRADELRSLIAMAETRLVVITGADSMALTATLLEATHVVAARDMVSPQMLAVWVETFYGALPHQPLSKALEFAMTASRAPMRLYAFQPTPIDLLLTMPATT